MELETRWHNSEELRASVRRRLINWGWHYRGGRVNLGFPTHSPFTTAPDSSLARPEEYIGQDDADLVEWIITSAAQAGEQAKYQAGVLTVEYHYGHLAQESKAKKLGLARSTYQRRRDAADYWFYVVSSGLTGNRQRLAA